MSGHAPGPWTITHWGINAALRAIVFDSTMYPEDANLIAAAPDMLEALQDNLTLMESEFDWATEGDACELETLCAQCQPAGCIRDKIDRTRAAIAKATESAS